MKRLRSLVPGCLALVMMLAVSVRAQVLKEVPADALVVVKFRNVKAVSDKLALLANKFGIAQMTPAAQDPLGTFKQSINVKNGLKEDGDAAVVIIKGDTQKPQFVLLLPVTDYQAFMANYPNAKTENGISAVTLPNKSDDEPGYVTQWGDYAAVSDTQSLLTQKPAGIAVSGVAAKQLETKDITVYANMPAIRDLALPKLQESRQQIKDAIERGMKMQNPQGADQHPGLRSAFIDELVDVAQQFLQQSKAATLGVQLTDDAIVPTAVVEFDPNASWGQSISQIKNTDQPLIVGLPEMKYLFVMGMSVDSDAAVKFIDNVTAPLEGELAKLGDQGKGVRDYISAVKDYFKAVKSQTTGLIAPTTPLGQGSLIQAVSVLKGDSQGILDAQKEMFKDQQAFMEMTGNKAQVQSTYTANAKTVDGVQLDKCTATFGPPAANASPQERQAQQMMTMMYGPNGLETFVGVISPEKAIGGVGVSDDVISQLITSAKADNAKVAQTQPVQQVASHLPKQRVFVMYVSLDNLAGTLMTYARQFGMPINVQVPENLQPLGMTIGTEGSAIRADGVIPAGTVEALISAGMQAYMNMQQGGPNPGAGARNGKSGRPLN